MKVFVSSVMSGYAAIRDAVVKAVEALGHVTIRAESFGASPDSPQVACLQAVRAADLTILIIGARYGMPQPSGRSATHEEYEEARQHSHVLVFIEEVAERETRAEDFLQEVQRWESGNFTQQFKTPADLYEKALGALHKYEIRQASLPLDEPDMRARAQNSPSQLLRAHVETLQLTFVPGPRRPVIRPVQLESQDFIDQIQQEAMFGAHRLLDRSERTASSISGHALRIEQAQAAIIVDELATLSVAVPAVRKDPRDHFLVSLIQEEVQEQIQQCLLFAAAFFARVDPKAHLSHVFVHAALLEVGAATDWRTREEGRNRGAHTLHLGGSRRIEAELAPAVRRLSSLRPEAAQIAEDLVIRIRRSFRS